MGAHQARAEAYPEQIPTWLCEQVLEEGVWPETMVDKARLLSSDSLRVTPRERLLLSNLIRSRRMAEVARVQLDAIEGLHDG